MLLWDGVLTPLVAAGNDSYLREREVAGQSFTIQIHSGAAHAIDGGTYWVITDTHGLVWRLGANSDSAWRYRDASGDAYTWRWNLDRVQDIHTNYQTWSYLTEAASLSGQPFERGGYLSEIAWNGNSALGRAPDRRLTFSYVARGTTTEPEYDPLTTRFYLTKRLDRVVFEVSQQTLWDYTFDYDLAVDGTRAYLLLRTITRHAADGTTVLNTTDLTYQSPFDEGEGFHLGGVAVNGTPQVGYEYETFSFKGVTRYRLSSIESHPDAPAALTEWTLRPAVWLNSGCEDTTRSFSYGPAAGDPSGSSFWSFSSTTIDNCRGDSYEQRFRTVTPFQGIAYKEFCQTIDPGGGTARQRLRLLWVAFVNLPRRQATSGSGVVCHEQARNFDAAGIVGGTTRLQVGAVFDDVRQDDGGYQHLQTNYTYTTAGQPRYIDQFGEQGIPDDDRYIERDYWLAAFPELLTRERVRDTNGAVLSEITYQYVPGTRLVASQGRRLLEEQRTLTTSYEYDARGLLVRITDPLGHSTRYGYDTAGQLLRIEHQRGGGSPTLLQDIRYTLDLNGNRTVVSDLHGSTTLTTTYHYDPLLRLTQASYPAIPSGPGTSTITYTLDAAGNRQSDGTTSFSYNVTDQITNTGYLYDANGNLLSDGTTTYQYDAADRLTLSVTAGVTTTYGYDGWGNLVRETRGSLTTDFVLDEAGGLVRILGSVRSDGVQEVYAYGPEGFAAQRAIISGTPQPVVYLLLDGQGSPRHLTDTSGNLVLSRRYDAWGTIQQSSGSATTRLGYTGELQIGALVYLRARWYNSTNGTFTSRDSFPGVPTRPQSLHRYTYTENNPVNRTDPSGHFTGAPPCNLLPNRPDTCTWENIQRWWESVCHLLGYHGCDFCKHLSPDIIVHRGDNRLSLGSAEIRVFGIGDIVYAAPDLIYHYVAEHTYCPPQDFIQAVLTCPLPGSPAYQAQASKLQQDWE